MPEDNKSSEKPYSIVGASGVVLSHQNKVVGVPAETKVFTVSSGEAFLADPDMNWTATRGDTPPISRYKRTVMDAARYINSPEYRAAMGNDYAVRVATRPNEHGSAMSAFKEQVPFQVVDSPQGQGSNEIGRRISSLDEAKSLASDNAKSQRWRKVPGTSRAMEVKTKDLNIARSANRFFTPAGQPWSDESIAAYLQFGINAQNELGFGGNPGMTSTKGVPYPPRYIRVASMPDINQHSLAGMEGNYDPFQGSKNLTKHYGAKLGAELSSNPDREIYIPRRAAYDPNIVQEVGLIRNTPGNPDGIDIVIRRPGYIPRPGPGAVLGKTLFVAGVASDAIQESINNYYRNPEYKGRLLPSIAAGTGQAAINLINPVHQMRGITALGQSALGIEDPRPISTLGGGGMPSQQMEYQARQPYRKPSENPQKDAEEAMLYMQQMLRDPRYYR